MAYTAVDVNSQNFSEKTENDIQVTVTNAEGRTVLFQELVQQLFEHFPLSQGMRLQKGAAMEDIHKIFTRFKEEFPDIFARHEALGKEIHEKVGPLGEKSRWLIKIAISGACDHKRALETHIRKLERIRDESDKVAYLPHHLGEQRRKLYKGMIEGARNSMTPELFEEFQRSF